MFHSLLNLNDEGRMVPDYNVEADEITYRIEKYIDLEEVLELLDEIDVASWQHEKKFDSLMIFVKSKAC